jgi:hypothetical protein
MSAVIVGYNPHDVCKRYTFIMMHHTLDEAIEKATDLDKHKVYAYPFYAVYYKADFGHTKFKEVYTLKKMIGKDFKSIAPFRCYTDDQNEFFFN